MIAETCFTGQAVTPSDDTLIASPVRALWVGGVGNLTVLMNNSGVTTLLIEDVPAGTWLPISVKKVMATGTTATKIVAFG